MLPLRFAVLLPVAVAIILAGCATTEAPRGPAMSAAEGRALAARLLPESVGARNGWATDIHAAMVVLEIPVTPENICAVVAITDQESNFRVDPPVPGLPGIAWKEIDARRERAGVPKFVLEAALSLESPTGRTYRQRIDAVRTEQQLSRIFEDFIGMVPMGKTFLADRNPVRTGGPMQVSIEFAEQQAAAAPYPYPLAGNVRDEVFTRRGGMYFGIAHLLDYRAPYAGPLYRFADFNAGRYASRNAAFQNAVTQASGVPLVLDGDLIRYERRQPVAEPGNTELATRTLARRLELDNGDIRRDLAAGKGEGFEKTALYERVFALAERQTGRQAPRAVVPNILLQSPKFTRRLTTEWFATRVERRYQACLGRLGG
ncbi:MAG: DUF1615 domain-containing protein [Betaproteobacteria bacterium]